MVVGSEESSDPGRDEDEPVVEIGKKLINITPFTGSDRNQAPGICARPPSTLRDESEPTPSPSNARTLSPLNARTLMTLTSVSTETQLVRNMVFFELFLLYFHDFSLVLPPPHPFLSVSLFKKRQYTCY